MGEGSIIPAMITGEPLRLSRAQVRDIDRRSTEEYGIPSIVLMENAARGVADVAVQMLDEIDAPSVIVVCGSGNNGGDGFAVARHLHNRGLIVEIVRDLGQAVAGDAAVNLAIVEKMPIDRTDLSRGIGNVLAADLVIDAMFGTGLTRAVGSDYAHVVDAINQQRECPVLAIDVPSGLDCDTGEPLGPCVRAARTVTFVAEKAGFANPRSREFTGSITVADIGCPRELIDEVARSR
jgi:NAD(P)H-hydrate epimerase